MAGKRTGWWSALVLLAIFMLPAPAPAGYFLGDWSWYWHPAPDCPRGTYSPLHYWFTEYYKARACLHPSNLDQYPPGPCPPIQANFNFRSFPCRSTLPAPTTPYAEPLGYYGRSVGLPFALP